jgi:outer membrane protein assembly factor BamD (BamD/ComL family)
MLVGCQEANSTENDQSGLSKKEQKELDAAYVTAKGLFDAGDYKNAFEQFQKLGSYKDSEELCIKAMLGFSDEFSPLSMLPKLTI